MSIKSHLKIYENDYLLEILINFCDRRYESLPNYFHKILHVADTVITICTRQPLIKK